jgi:hypothetical protein
MYTTPIITLWHFSNFIQFTVFGNKGIHSLGKSFVYRGQPANKSKVSPLLPKVGRENFKAKHPEYDHERAFVHWLKMGAAFTPGATLQIEARSGAQHFGLPTALLDWSQNPYVALWFACQAAEDGPETDAEVICLYLSEGLTRSHASDASSVIFHNPRWIDARMRAQQAAFTFHPKLQALELEELPPLESRKMCQRGLDFDRMMSGIFTDKQFQPHKGFNGYHDYLRAGKFHNLCRLFIPAGCKRIILKDLDSMGINSTFIYPDAEGLVRHLRWMESPEPDPNKM